MKTRNDPLITTAIEFISAIACWCAVIGLVVLGTRSDAYHFAQQDNKAMTESTNLAVATFGSGCFWCTEAVFQQLNGVSSVVSGYSGGKLENPTYKQVSTGRSGHAEVVQVTYDPDVVAYPKLLEVFWKSHDPTTRNRQGNDRGPQYRSAIFYHNDEQRRLAEEYRSKLDKSGAFRRKIVTEIVAFEEFYPAEDYHQDYFRLNPAQPYCQVIIGPKLAKIRRVFAEDLKDD